MALSAKMKIMALNAKMKIMALSTKMKIMALNAKMKRMTFLRYELYLVLSIHFLQLLSS